MSSNNKDAAPIIEKLRQFYDEFAESSLDKLGDIYTEDVTFIDPIHQTNGLNDLKAYFKHTMGGVSQCHFAFDEQRGDNEVQFLTWQMRLIHPKLAKGREIVVPGVSELHIRDDKIRKQQDYYDLGAMLYEHIAILGFVIDKVKQRLVLKD